MSSRDPVELERQLLAMTRGLFANFCIALVAVGRFYNVDIELGQPH